LGSLSGPSKFTPHISSSVISVRFTSFAAFASFHAWFSFSRFVRLLQASSPVNSSDCSSWSALSAGPLRHPLLRPNDATGTRALNRRDTTAEMLGANRLAGGESLGSPNGTLRPRRAAGEGVLERKRANQTEICVWNEPCISRFLARKHSSERPRASYTLPSP